MTTSIYTLSLHDALPIFQTIAMTLDGFPHGGGMRGQKEPRHMNEIRRQAELRSHPLPAGELTIRASSSEARSEERRVGKSVDLGGRRIIKKKNGQHAIK